MSRFVHLRTISDLFNLFGLGHNTQHPLVAVVDFSKVGDHIENGDKVSAEFYTVMFKNYSRNNIKYGRKTIDFQDGSLICMAPNQVIEMNDDIEMSSNMLGWGLFFHSVFFWASFLFCFLLVFCFFSFV